MNRISKIAIIIVTLIVVAISDNAFANGNDKKSFTEYSGRLVRAALRFPPGSFSTNLADPVGESVEDVLSSLLNNEEIWRQFSYEQKREFALLAIVYADIQGGDATMLLQLLGAEGKRISLDLGKITDQTLSERLYLNKEGIELYRSRLQFLSGTSK